MLPLIFVTQYLFSMLMSIEYANLVYILVYVIVAAIGILIYYKYTENNKWFMKKGEFWVEDGILYIQTERKIYEVKNVKWLRGTTVSAYGYAKSGMLVIQFQKTKVVFVSTSIDSTECFADSELFPLFETILHYNPQLKKDDTIEFWYEFNE